MNRFVVDIPIIRKNYEKTKSAKFKGLLSIVSNEHGVIYDWKINFSEVFIDLYTTHSWFVDQRLNFQRRNSLFNEIGLEQEKRDKTIKNKIIKLDNVQLKKTNDFLNNRQKYNSTIKNIIGLFKGNNPGGEAKKPSSGELIIDSMSNIKNFVILLDDLTMKNKIEYNSISIGAKKITFEKFVTLNKSIESAFLYMQKDKSMISWINYLNVIKEYYREYNFDIQRAYKIAEKARSKYNKNIDKNIDKFPFGYISKDEFQKCHIYEYRDIREKIIQSIRNNKNYSQYENMIKDFSNFIPLPEAIHRKFDANYFTYKEDGKIYPINDEGADFIKKFIKEKFYKIPEFFLTKDRIQYLEKRNKNLLL